MNCPNCGTLNNASSKFCIKCGQSLETAQVSTEHPIQASETSFQEVSAETINNTPIQSENNFQTSVTSQKTINTNTSSEKQISFMGYFFIILAVILKPFTAFKEELSKFNGFKNSIILSVIVSGVATIANLVMSMLNSVMVKSFDWSSGSYTTTWTWENLKNIDYLEVIGKNFLIYLGVIVAIATVYYIASLIVKKQTNFARLLGISAMAVMPMIICSLILSPLLSLIWDELAIPITLIGVVYTVVLIYEGINSEISLNGNAKYYFNLVCLSILGIAAFYLYVKLFISSISGDVEEIMNLFG